MFGQGKTALGAFIQTFPFLSLVILIPLMTYTRSIAGALAIVAAFSGLSMILAAKWPSFKRREFFSFGPYNMDQRHKRLYLLGYFFVIAGILGSLFVVLTR